MKNINFLYEFMTPNGYLPMGYERKDLPMILSHAGEIVDDEKQNNIIRTRKEPIFQVDDETPDSLDMITTFLHDGSININQDSDYNISRVLVRYLTEDQLTNDLNLFLIASIHGEMFTDYIENLNFDDIFNPNSMELLKKNDNVRLVFFDDKEGAHDYSDNFFKKLFDFVSNHGIYNKIVLMTNTSNIDEIYKKYLSKCKTSSFMTCAPLHYLIQDMPGKNIIRYKETTNNYKKQIIKERGTIYSIDEVPNKEKRNKYYLCMNRNSERLHRPRLILELMKRNMFDKGSISLFRSEGFDRWCETHPEFKPIQETYPFVIDYDDPELVSDMHGYFTKRDMWNETYFSIVNETSVNRDSVFITEKSIRPIIYFHPFILYASPNTLSVLQNLGFETFPEFFNESYDKIEDEHERLNMIINNVDRLCALSLEELHNLYLSVEDKLIYNRNLLVKFVEDRKTFNDFLHILTG